MSGTPDPHSNKQLALSIVQLICNHRSFILIACLIFRFLAAMSSFSTVGLIFAACASSAFAMGLDGFDLPSMLSNRSLLTALGVLILGIAGYMLLNCPCCSSGKCSPTGTSGKKTMKKHTVRTASVDSKRNSSSSSVRKSPRKSKLN